jgi:predicted  nucleic acid-binding Zn-ribbon protein
MGSLEDVARYFRLRFEAAEERYAGMKGLTCAALEKVRCIERENKDLRCAGSLSRLGLEPLHSDALLSVFVGQVRPPDDEVKRCIGSLVEEMSRVLAENVTLVKENKLLRQSGASIHVCEFDKELERQYLKAIDDAKRFSPEIATLRAQISAMEFGWTQAKNLRDELFDYDSKLREHEMVADAMCLRRPSSSEGVKIFATSHRHMIEILVEDRNRNVNGYYARHVPSLEKLRVVKDAEILALRRRICALELVTGVTSMAEIEALGGAAALEQASTARHTLATLKEEIADVEGRLGGLKRTVQSFEDHVCEWKAAHDEAANVISKAECFRQEYEGMMARLREEDARILAKKKELEKPVRRARNVDDSYSRLRAISDEVDEAEGEIAARENALKRLRASLATKEKALNAEKKALGLLELEVDRLGLQRGDLEAYLESRRGGGSKFLVEDGDDECGNNKRVCVEDPADNDEDVLTEGFSGVCV